MISHQRIKSQHAFQAALYLGLRQKEWLFLTCHNYWIVTRLVKRVGQNPFLAFSPLITIEDSSVPFRAFLGAILSVVRGVVVEASVFDDSNSQTLNAVDEAEEGASPTSDTDDGSGEYRGRSGQGSAGHRPVTRKLAQDTSKKDALMVRPSYATLSLNGPSEVHLDRFRHLPHYLLSHLRFGSIYILFRTISSSFRHLSTMADVCG